MHATALGISEHFKELGVGMERMMGPDIHEDICYGTYAAGRGGRRVNAGLVYIYPMVLCIHIYTTIVFKPLKSKDGRHSHRRFAIEGPMREQE